MQPIIPIDRFEIFATGLDHPECLAFDADGYCWAGGEAGQVYRIVTDGKPEEVANLGSFNAGLAFSPTGELFVCNPAQGVIRVDPHTGRHEVFASHACGEKIICANFPHFDDAGNLYVSDSGQWMKRNGRVVCFSPEGAEFHILPFGYANGLALDAPKERLFIVESDTNRLLSYDMDALGLPEPVAENVGRMPDGVVRDAATGNLYVTCYASDEIWRISPDGKKELFAHDPWAIKLSRPTNLVFRDGYVYVANLGRYTIVRAKL